MSHILVVDDEQAVCWALQRALTQEGHDVAVASSAEDAFALARGRRPDAVILDVRLPGMDGLTALARFRELTADAPVIVVTAFGNLSTAVRAEQGGAFEYLVKPFDLGQCLETVARALQRRRSQKPPPAEEAPPEEIVGRSPAMQTVFKRIALVAPRDSCVLSGQGAGGSPARGGRVAPTGHQRSAARGEQPAHAVTTNLNEPGERGGLHPAGTNLRS